MRKRRFISLILAVAIFSIGVFSSMASAEINNGNSDFGLMASQIGNSLTLQFAFHGDTLLTGGQNPLRVTVTAPYTTFFDKSYTTGETQYVQLQLPYYGQYIISVSSAKGYLYDSLKVTMVPPNEVKSTKYTFTASDITRCKIASSTINIITYLIGFVELKAVGWILSSMGLVQTFGETWGENYILPNGTALKPIEGWTWQNDYIYINGYEYHWIDVWDNYGNFQGSIKVNTIKLPTI